MKFKIRNNTLNPEIWNNDNTLKPEIGESLRKIASDFYKECELKSELEDVLFLGSLANYNYNSKSDIDLHLLVDTSDISMPELQKEKYLKSLSFRWNTDHNVKIKNHKVEVYIQDIKEKNESTGVYSLGQDKWIEMPEIDNIVLNKPLIKSKYHQLSKQIDNAIKEENVDKLKVVLKNIMDIRQRGLDLKGEYSESNIAFKILRDRGDLKKLKDAINKNYDKLVSVNEISNIVENLTEKDIKASHPELQNYIKPDGTIELSKLTLDNLKALREKSARFILQYKKSGNKNNITTEFQLFKQLDDELKNRLNYINNPVKEISNIVKEITDIKGNNFKIVFGDKRVSKNAGIIYLGNIWFANTYKNVDNQKWALNRVEFKMEFPENSGWFNSPKEVLDYLEKWYTSKKINNPVKEGYGAKDPKTDPLHIPGERWRIKWDNRKTPILKEENNTETFQMYHGGQKWYNIEELKPINKGKYEHGVGIYLTTNYETARKYAKGNKVVTIVDINKNFTDITKINLNSEEVLSFLINLPRLKNRNNLINDIKSYLQKRNTNVLPAEILNNLVVNNESGNGIPGVEITRFLVSKGVDAEVVKQSNEDWLVVFNPKIIKKFQYVNPKDVNNNNYNLPKLDSFPRN